MSVCRTLNTCLTRNKNLSDTIVEFRSHQTPEIISSIAQQAYQKPRRLLETSLKKLHTGIASEQQFQPTKGLRPPTYTVFSFFLCQLQTIQLSFFFSIKKSDIHKGAGIPSFDQYDEYFSVESREVAVGAYQQLTCIHLSSFALPSDRPCRYLSLFCCR